MEFMLLLRIYVCMACAIRWACVTGNRIGAEGAASLSEVLKCCSKLKGLDLSREWVGGGAVSD